MKIFAISDLHLCISGAKPMEIFGDGWVNYQENVKANWKQKVADDDVVLLAGDLSWAMKIEEAEKDFEYFNDLPGKKIIIRGNHDYWWNSISVVRSKLKENMFALQNDAIKIGDYIFCGTRGWIPRETKGFSEQDEKIYKREAIRLEMALDSAKRLQINNEKIICLLHYPPFDSNKNGNEFLDLLFKYNVDSCVFGHLHGYHAKYELKTILGGVKFYLTSCDIVNNNLIQIKGE